MRKESARRTLKPKLGPPQDDGTVVVAATLEFLTPMFGGGVALRATKVESHLKEHDPITPVRGAALRGALRTWWRRACANELDLDTMRAREKLLWGWASTKGLVAIRVDGSRLRGTTVEVYERHPHNGRVQPRRDAKGIAYGAFPLQPAQDAGPNAPLGTLTRWEGTFDATLRLRPWTDALRAAAAAAWKVAPDEVAGTVQAEVARAWLAFTTFGGLGARTRRGFGAVALTEGARHPRKAAEALGWSGRVTPRPGTFRSAEEAFNDLLATLKDFRQGVDVGRNEGEEPHRPGRSRWPEPDTLRRALNTHANQHAPTHPVQAFPRAAFGLPILFKFKDDRARPRPDPGQQSLQPTTSSRLASPLLLRIVRLPDGHFLGLLLELPRRVPVDTYLRTLTLSPSNAQVAGAAPTGLITAADQARVRPLADHRTVPNGGAEAVYEPFRTFFSK